MTKRDEAFELFSQGKTPDDPEVVALGLAKASLKKYYSEWERLQPEAVEEAPVVETVEEAPEPVEVPEEALPTVSSIQNGATFEFQGLLFSKEGIERGMVIGKRSDTLGQVAFSPDEPVKPK